MTDKKYKLLDLFCGAGGAGMGYHRAGFEVVGVDIAPQKHYPFEFHQSDSFEYLREHGHEFDVIHASPPCQAYSVTKHAHKFNPKKKNHPDLVGRTRILLDASNKKWIIENVNGSPLMFPSMLCGTQFGLKVYRHRYFEIKGLYILTPSHSPHKDSWTNKHTNCIKSKNGFMGIYGHHAFVSESTLAMGINWMNQKELAQAIPPAYTEYIGKQLMKAL